MVVPNDDDDEPTNSAITTTITTTTTTPAVVADSTVVTSTMIPTTLVNDHKEPPLPPLRSTPGSNSSNSNNSSTTSHRRIVQRRRRVAPDQQSSLFMVTLDTEYIQRVLQESNLPIQVYSFEMERTVQRCCSMILQQQQPSSSSSSVPLNFHVALQMPEGLLLYATVLVDVLQKLISHHYHRHHHHQLQHDHRPNDRHKKNNEDITRVNDTIRPLEVQMSILSDVTYGACCIDDITASLMKCHLLIHYGHSCLVPIQHTVIPVHYVFVEIQFYIPHCVDSIDQTLFPPPCTTTAAVTTTDTTHFEPLPIHVYLLGTIQFRHALSEIRDQLLLKYHDRHRHRRPANDHDDDETTTTTALLTISIPQCKPLSPGEVLGCTSPILNHHHCHSTDNDAANRITTTTTSSSSTDSTSTDTMKKTRAVVCFIADGRFHLESTMISNHSVIDTFYRYDPYSRILSIEQYEFDEMKRLRYDAIQYASQHATMFGIILGTLGRQGNPAIVQRIQTIIRQHVKQYKSFVVLLSEITPQKLHLLSQSYCRSSSKDTLCWVQVACPRLSVDWGHSMSLNDRPMVVLNPYELYVALEEADWCCGKDNNRNNNNNSYPMDYYSNSGGPWTNYYDTNRERQMI